MTREAKLGAGVASAFLAVIGTWAAIKFSRGERPATATEDQPVATASESAAANQNPPSGETNPASQPVVSATTTTPAPEQTPIVVQQPAVVVPQPDSSATTPTSSSIVAAPTSAEPPPPSMPEPAVTAGAAPPNNTLTATATDAPPPALPVAVPITQETKTEPIPPPSTPAPSMPITLPSNDPSAAPIVETKKDTEPPPPPSTIVITKPAETPPPEPVKPPEPSVTVVPAGVGSAASLGAPGSSGAPATGVAAARPRTEPRVQSYLEEEYRWQPGDTFANICQKYYFAEKYGPALQEYNRDHPLAGSGMRQNPPAMSPGQAIWVPPVRILERDYANSIGDLRPLNDRGGTFVPTVKPVNSQTLPHSPNGTKHFKVRERGETMYEIARRTLGDSGQWFVVHRLNPTLSRDPKLPIPGGTVLQLPVEAKMEPADAP